MDGDIFALHEVRLGRSCKLHECLLHVKEVRRRMWARLNAQPFVYFLCTCVLPPRAAAASLLVSLSIFGKMASLLYLRVFTARTR